MTRARVAAALTATITALLLQATVVAPATFPWPISLPAVLVAAVALVDGPATGMSLGFAVGLFADLGSHHPAGVLALCWMGVGLLCGTFAERRSARRDALIAGVACALSAVAATLLLTVLNSGGSLRDAVVHALPTLLGDALLALLVVPVVRRMLATDSLRAARSVYTELAVSPPGRTISPIGPDRG
jgi:cell shape-determining protein MreD